MYSESRKNTKKQFAAWILVAILFLMPAGKVKATSDGTYRQDEARSMIEYINAFRHGSEAWYWNEDNTEKIYCSGLGDLTYDYELEKVAMLRAKEIAQSFSHTRPDGTSCWTAYNECGYDWQWSVGENIAYGQTSAYDVYMDWREDEDPYDGQGHRRNMLGESFKAIGIGCYELNGRKYWVQEFTGNTPTGSALVNPDITGTPDPNTGNCGEGVTWSFDPNTGIMTVSGNGALEDTSSWGNFVSEISELIIEPGVTSIEDGTISICSNLSNIVLPEGLTSIGRTFGGINKLKSIYIPASVTNIGRWAFEGCSGLEEINVDSENTVYSSKDGVLFNKAKTILLRYPQAKSGTYTVPESVTLIEKDSFEYCSKLTSISIPETTEISEADGDFNVFYGCTSLADENGFVIIRDILYQCVKNRTDIIIPDGIIAIGFGAFWNCRSLRTLTIPSSLKAIGLDVFGGSLSDVYYDGSMSEWIQIKIGQNNWELESAKKHFTSQEIITGTCGTDTNWSFDPDTGVMVISGTGSVDDTSSWNNFGSEIIEIIVEPGVTSIEDWTISICSNLSNIVLPEGLTSIGRTFGGINKLKSVYIPASVTNIGRWAFEGCSGLEEIIVDQENTVYSSEDGVLFNKDKTILLRYPQAKSGAYTVPDSVTLIDRDSFEYCDKLTSIEIPETTEISEADGDFNVFYGCTGLADENDFVIIRNVLYQYLKNDSDLIVPDGIRAIGFAAISNCNVLRSVTFPESLKAIGLHAFFGLNNLKDIYYLGSESDWGNVQIGANNQPIDTATKHFDLQSSYVMLGDVDGDSQITPKDITNLRRYLVGGWNVDIIKANADINKDGTISTKDVTLLKRFLAGGWGVILSGNDIQIIGNDEIALSEEGVVRFKLVDNAVDYLISCSAEGSGVGYAGYIGDTGVIKDGYMYVDVSEGLTRYYVSRGYVGEEVRIYVEIRAIYSDGSQAKDSVKSNSIVFLLESSLDAPSFISFKKNNHKYLYTFRSYDDVDSYEFELYLKKYVTRRYGDVREENSNKQNLNVIQIHPSSYDAWMDDLGNGLYVVDLLDVLRHYYYNSSEAASYCPADIGIRIRSRNGEDYSVYSGEYIIENFQEPALVDIIVDPVLSVNDGNCILSFTPVEEISGYQVELHFPTSAVLTEFSVEECLITDGKCYINLSEKYGKEISRLKNDGENALMSGAVRAYRDIFKWEIGPYSLETNGVNPYVGSAA